MRCGIWAPRERPNDRTHLTKERDLSVIRRCFMFECLMLDVYCGDKFKCIGNKIGSTLFGAQNVRFVCEAVGSERMPSHGIGLWTPAISIQINSAVETQCGRMEAKRRRRIEFSKLQCFRLRHHSLVIVVNESLWCCATYGANSSKQ